MITLHVFRTLMLASLAANGPARALPAQSEHPEVDEELLEEIHREFDHFDANGDGVLDREEFVRGVLHSFGQEERGQRSADDPWVPEIPHGKDPIPTIDTSTSPDGIVDLPQDIDPRISRIFDRYTKVLAPHGKPIHILAQSAWRRDQIVRARKVLQHILSPVPGSRLGSDKTAVANAMADRRATLVLFADERALERALRGPFGEVELGCQDLRANECPVEGDAEYMKNQTRDAVSRRSTRVRKGLEALPRPDGRHARSMLR